MIFLAIASVVILSGVTSEARNVAEWIPREKWTSFGGFLDFTSFRSK